MKLNGFLFFFLIIYLWWVNNVFIIHALKALQSFLLQLILVHPLHLWHLILKSFHWDSKILVYLKIPFVINLPSFLIGEEAIWVQFIA